MKWIFLTVIILIALAFLAWRRRRRVVSSRAPFVDRIHLELEENPHWRRPEVVRDSVERLRSVGFVEAGTFHVREIPGVLVMGLVHPKEGIAATVLDHPQGGAWCELTLEYEGGGSLSVSNSPQPNLLDPMPGHTSIHCGECSADDLYHRIRRKLGKGAVVPATVENVAARVEQAHACDADWRIERGFTEDEMQRIASSQGVRITNEEAQELARQQTAAARLGKLTRESLEAVDEKQKQMEERWGVGRHERWELDPQEGVARFFAADGAGCEADAQIIGSYDRRQGTWEWAWNDPNVPQPLCADAAEVRRWGTRHEVEPLTVAVLREAEALVVGLSAIAVSVTGSEGFYLGEQDGRIVACTLRHLRPLA